MLATDQPDPSLGELERQAERNREALVQTMGTLQSKLSPSALKEDVREFVREKKDGLLQSVEDMARENPIQTAAIAAGIAYPLWAIARRMPVPLLLIGAGFALAGRSRTNGYTYGETGTGVGQRVSDMAADVGERASDVATAVTERASAVGSQLSDRASAVGSTISDQAQRSMDTARQLAGSAKEQAQAAASSAQAGITQAARSAQDMANAAISATTDSAVKASEWVNERVARDPLIVAAVGLAIGAAIAAAIPTTRTETEYLGDAAARARRRARQAAREGYESVKDAAGDFYREVAEDAKANGLSRDAARNGAGDVMQRAKNAARSTMDTDDTDSTPTAYGTS
jgi:hypothetical protein